MLLSWIIEINLNKNYVSINKAECKMIDLKWKEVKFELKARNYERARVLLEELNSCNEAKLQLAYLYFNGLGGSVDLSRARELYQALAEDGNADGMYYLGRLFVASGEIRKALIYFEMSSSLSHPSGTFWAAELYNGLYGNKVDKEKYKFLVRRAANLGHIYALRNLALDDIRHEKNFFLILNACMRYFCATIKGVVISIRDPHDLRIR